MARNGKLLFNLIRVIVAVASLITSQCFFAQKPVFGTAISVASSTADDQGDQAFQKLLRDLDAKDSYEKHRAVIALGRSGNPAAVEPLIKALGSDDTSIRSFAALSLGNLKDRRALDPLIKALKDKNELVRSAAAEALGTLHDPGAVGPLIQSLSDESVFARRAAALALGNFGTQDVVEPLIKVLREADGFVASGASAALTNIGSAAIPGLVNALGDWTAGPRAAQVLKDLGWKSSTDQEKVRFDVAMRNRESLLKNWEIARKVLLSDANSGNARLVENAAYALIGIGRTDTLDELKAILDKNGTPEMATAFLQCGNARLAEMARSWAVEHKKEIEATEDIAMIQWGALQAY